MLEEEVAKEMERLRRYDEELSKVMPIDKKDWWENSKEEWPLVARMTIESLQESEELAWEHLNLRYKATSVKTKAEIEERIRRTQDELTRLKTVLAGLEKFPTPIKTDNELSHCLEILKSPQKNLFRLVDAFCWIGTAQGWCYWDSIRRGYNPITESDLNHIREWVCNYLIQKENIND